MDNSENDGDEEEDDEDDNPNREEEDEVRTNMIFAEEVDVVGDAVDAESSFRPAVGHDAFAFGEDVLIGWDAVPDGVAHEVFDLETLSGSEVEVTGVVDVGASGEGAAALPAGEMLRDEVALFTRATISDGALEDETDAAGFINTCAALAPLRYGVDEEASVLRAAGSVLRDLDGKGDFLLASRFYGEIILTQSGPADDLVARGLVGPVVGGTAVDYAEGVDFDAVVLGVVGAVIDCEGAGRSAADAEIKAFAQG